MLFISDCFSRVTESSQPIGNAKVSGVIVKRLVRVCFDMFGECYWVKKSWGAGTGFSARQ